MFASRSRVFRLFSLAFLGLFAVTPARAEPIVPGSFTVSVFNQQSIELFAGTPFNPGTDPFTVTVLASGSLTVKYSAQVGNVINIDVSARLSGVFPSPLQPIPFEILAGTPDLPPSLGVISNVVQNPNDPGFATGSASSFVSGDSSTVSFFKQVLPDGTTIYSDPDPAAIFTASLTGLPYPVGTTFVSPERLNLYLQLGPGFDPTRDLLIGQSFNRSLTVVPEPSSVLMVLTGMGVLAGASIKKSAS
ncbi:PEP-CTERM sorting domain-containing protein [Isosphaeraceae bacterium EP7]